MDIYLYIYIHLSLYMRIYIYIYIYMIRSLSILAHWVWSRNCFVQSSLLPPWGGGFDDDAEAAIRVEFIGGIYLKTA